MIQVSMRRGATVTLLAAALIQCYATRTGDGCVPLSVYTKMAECRKLASEYQKFDTRDLRCQRSAGGGQLSLCGGRVTVCARGRVGMWRGGGRLGMSVFHPFRLAVP